MLEVQLLGLLSLADSGHRVEAVRNPRLIAYLVLDRHRALDRTEVAFVNMYMDEGQGRVRKSYRKNYDRLARAKTQFDPDNVFRINQNIRPA